MKIAVIGATGNTGSVVAELALDDGHDLRVVARDPDSSANLAARGAEVIPGDLDDPASITAPRRQREPQ